jgi:hypothetical protein
LFCRATSPDVRGKLRRGVFPGECGRKSPALVSQARLTRVCSHPPVRWQPDGHCKCSLISAPGLNPQSTYG